MIAQYRQVLRVRLWRHGYGVEFQLSERLTNGQIYETLFCLAGWRLDEFRRLTRDGLGADALESIGHLMQSNMLAGIRDAGWENYREIWP